MKLIISGCRNYTSYSTFIRRVELVLKGTEKSKVTILTGESEGVESMARRYAEENNIKVMLYPIEWDKYGKSAVYKRNEKMVLEGYDALIFNDGEDNCVLHLIEQCDENELSSIIIKVKPDQLNKQ